MEFSIYLLKLGTHFFIVLKKNKGLFFLSLFSFYKLLNFTDLNNIGENYDKNYAIIGAIFKALYQDQKPMYPTPSKEEMSNTILKATQLANAVRFGEIRDEGLSSFSNLNIFQKLRTIFALIELNPKAFAIKKTFQFLFFIYFASKLVKKIYIEYVDKSKNNKK